MVTTGGGSDGEVLGELVCVGELVDVDVGDVVDVEVEVAVGEAVERDGDGVALLVEADGVGHPNGGG